MNKKTEAERYNDRMAKIFEDARRLKKERIAKGEVPNPSLTDMSTFVPVTDIQKRFAAEYNARRIAAGLPV